MKRLYSDYTIIQPLFYLPAKRISRKGNVPKENQMFEKFMDLRAIKSYMFPMVDDDGAGGGTASGADVDAGTGQPVVTDSTGDVTPAQTPPDGDQAAAAAAAEPNYLFEYGDKKFTAEDITAAIDSHNNRTSWETKNLQKNEELNILARVLEEQRQAALNPNVNPSVQTPQTQLPQITGAQLQEMIYERPDEAMATIGNLIQSAVQDSLGQFGNHMEAKNSFLSKYSDFNETIANPEFLSYQNANPHFNQVNAYAFYKLEKANQNIERATKEGFNKGEQTTIQNQKAKGTLRVLAGGGGSGVSTNAPQNIASMSPAERASAAVQAIQKIREAKGG
jgi:hypothetical protein